MTGHPIKIILIEDNPGDVRLIKEMLNQAMPGKFEITCVDRLEKVAKILTKANIDILLLDLGLPDSQGIDTFDKVNAKAVTLPIVVLTDLRDNEVGLSAVQKGAQDYLIKGQVDGNLLSRAIHYAIKRKHIEEELKIKAQLLNAATDSIFVHDFDGNFIYVNEAAYKIRGYTRDELMSLNLHELDLPEYAKLIKPRIKELLEKGATIFESAHVCKDRTIMPIEVHARIIESGGKKLVLSIVHDITERKQAEEALCKVNRALKTLSVCNEILVRATSESALLNDICQTIIKVSGYRMVWVGFVEKNKKKTVRPVAHAGYEKGFLDAVTMTWAYDKQGSCPIGMALQTGKSYISKDINTDPNSASSREEALKRGYASSIAIPLMADNQSIGILNIYADKPDAFDKEEIKLLSELADDLAYGIIALRIRIERKEVDEQLKRSFDKLKRTLEETVNALSSVLAQRDPYTAAHQLRVTKLACAIASEMGFSREAIDGIRIAGLLHDIGKISVPAEILSKPTKLTDAEFAIVKTHSLVGYEILKSIEFPWPVAKIVLQHHERQNGSGYPASVKADEILPEARILAVADVAEAMSSHRPYRPARGMQMTLEEISKNRGILYDPDAVDACLRLFNEKGFKFE